MPPSAEPGDPKRDQLAEAELLSWARKRGGVTFLIFFTIAAAIAVCWYLTR